MLNRRKQLQVDDEREPLVGSSFHTPDNSVFTQLPQAGYVAPNQYVVQNSAHMPSETILSSSMPNQRKTRDKSPEVQRSHLVSRHSANTSIGRRHESLNHSAVPIQPYSGESYELLASTTSDSRAIDLGGNNESYKQQIDFIYYTVQPGDTLHNLSVKYSCPVASIKRLNNLWSDQEFYGLTKLKLPVGKLRLIADVIDEEKTKSNISSGQVLPTIPTSSSSLGFMNQFPTTSSNNSVQAIEEDIVHNDECNNPPYGGNSRRSSSVSELIFKNLDLNIAKARTAARSYDDNASAIFQSLVESGNIVVEDDDNDPNKIARREAETLLNDMSDYGLSYSGLILFIFIVCLICPLAYVIYLEETHHDSNKAP